MTSALTSMPGGVLLTSVQTTSGPTHSISQWNSFLKVDASTQDVTVTLPTPEAGKIIFIVIEDNTNEVFVQMGSVSHTLNGVTGSGGNVAKLRYSNTRFQFLKIMGVSSTEVAVDASEGQNAYTQLIWQLQQLGSDFSTATHYLQGDGAISGLFDSGTACWFAICFHAPWASGSSIHNLCGTDNYGVGLYGAGGSTTYLTSTGTSGYLNSPTEGTSQVPFGDFDDGNAWWVVVEYTGTNWNGWVNNVAYWLSDSWSVNPPASPSGNVNFGKRPASVTNYHYEFVDATIRTILVGTSHTALTTGDLNNINANVGNYDDLPSSVTDKVTNGWQIGDNTITTKKGSVGLTVAGTGHTYAEVAP